MSIQTIGCVGEPGLCCIAAIHDDPTTWAQDFVTVRFLSQYRPEDVLWQGVTRPQLPSDGHWNIGATARLFRAEAAKLASMIAVNLAS